jgi:hypothetical protein
MPMTLKEFDQTPKMKVWRVSGNTIQKVKEPIEKVMPFKYNRLVLVKGKSDGEEAEKSGS